MADGVKDAVASTPHLRQILAIRQEKPAGGQNCTTNATCHHGTWMGETCQHEQKSLKTAFLLSFLLGNIGADRLYLGYVGSGVAKLLINLFFYMCRTLNGGRQADLAYGATVGTLLVSAATVWLWWLVDWIMIVTDALPDDSGYPLFDNL
ncbi:TM2 domain containing protein [Acanthamoeba castellanii str. Neff]|uniref:TM2 domain containing protein n=1 Tax=Acanthamoeba castellanii (strain ATCC 30010 / Neff) TaxID=1257118 RepID=L8HAT7_ACACF|nr:TM2 domain containing protein [Acanthamoeba castellanii str. Neff]ELR22372.1 TM2 domain containing protein [Acanthamoeba castellanii str. Neff]